MRACCALHIFVMHQRVSRVSQPWHWSSPAHCSLSPLSLLRMLSSPPVAWHASLAFLILGVVWRQKRCDENSGGHSASARAAWITVEGMHGLKPCPALAAAISELSIAIAFALSIIIFLIRGGSEWEWMGHVESLFAFTCHWRVTETFCRCSEHSQQLRFTLAARDTGNKRRMQRPHICYLLVIATFPFSLSLQSPVLFSLFDDVGTLQAYAAACSLPRMLARTHTAPPHEQHGDCSRL